MGHSCWCKCRPASGRQEAPEISRRERPSSSPALAAQQHPRRPPAIIFARHTTGCPVLGYPARMNDADALALRNVLVGPEDPEIVRLDAELRAAQLTADVTALDRLIAEDLLFTGPDGELATKAQDLAAHRSGIVRIREHQPTELRIRRIGDNVAIAALCARLTVEVNGTTVRGTYRYTRVWAREQGTWRVAGGHVAPAPEPAEATPEGGAAKRA
jgi:ketosteroid isomerase-like protein